VKKNIELPQRYWLKNYFTVDVKDYFSDPIGHYILTFTNPNYLARRWQGENSFFTQVYERSYLTVTNLAVTEKRIQPQGALYGNEVALSSQQLETLGNIYWVTNLSNLEAVPSAQVSLYQSKNLNLAGAYSTDAQGIAKTKSISDLGGAIVEKDGDSTIIPSYQSNISWADSAYASKKIYLYTDKPIYRPSQEVLIKGIYRIGYDGTYEIYKDKKINLKIYNSKYDEISNQNLSVSDFGTFESKLALESNAPLGTYRICVDNYSCSYFDVQEYVPAAFEVAVQSDKEEYVSKETVNLDVTANYYFGVPLEGGDVEYTISSQNYYFDRYSGGYFSFGAGWWDSYGFGDKFILRGKTSLSSSGKAKISETLDLEKIFKNEDERMSKIIVVDDASRDATVKIAQRLNLEIKSQ